MTIVRSRQKPEDFQTWVQQLTAKAETEGVRESLAEFASAQPRPIGPFHPQQVLMKKWDGFSLTMYGDGKQLKFGDNFSGFVPNQ